MRIIQDHAAFKNGTTIYLKSVKDPCSVERILKPADSNKKLSGGVPAVTKGAWKGMPVYSLTLQERSTCPKTCGQWKNCYGNNMPFSHRIEWDSPSFLPTLKAEIQSLLTKHPKGIVVRLHVLGDFYSTSYVNFWASMLKTYSSLRLFGYTHRKEHSAIGKAIQKLNSLGAWIRWSDAGGLMSANVEGEGITCPEQTGKTAGCQTCALCWSTTKPINFLRH